MILRIANQRQFLWNFPTFLHFLPLSAWCFLLFLLLPMKRAQSACKGLSKSACEAKGGCAHVKAHTRSNGSKVSAFCRKTNGNGSSTAKKKSTTKNRRLKKTLLRKQRAKNLVAQAVKPQRKLLKSQQTKNLARLQKRPQLRRSLQLRKRPQPRKAPLRKSQAAKRWACRISAHHRVCWIWVMRKNGISYL